MNLFGKKKQAGPSLADSIKQLREAMDTLEKREQHISKQIQLTLNEAKKKSKLKDKRGALFQLKRKKMLEKQIDQIYGKKSNIETQIMALENAAGNKEVLGAMRRGADALRRTVQETDVDKVADVMEDITDSMAVADELGDAMSQPIGNVIDDDELTNELEEMERDLINEDLLKAPEVPVHKIESVESNQVEYKAAPAKVNNNKKEVVVNNTNKVEKSKEQEELEELTRSMGMEVASEST